MLRTLGRDLASDDGAANDALHALQRSQSDAELAAWAREWGEPVLRGLMELRDEIEDGQDDFFGGES